MEVLPLNAIIYNQDKVKMEDVVAPPYDVIDDKYQDELYSRSEFNCVRLILNKSEDRYLDSAKCLCGCRPGREPECCNRSMQDYASMQNMFYLALHKK